MSTHAATGERIRAVRLAANIGQTELAKELGSEKSNGLVSKIENGRVVVDDQQLEILADNLDCTTELLQRPMPDVIATRPWLRAYADASAKTVESVQADNVLVHEFVDHVQLLRVPDTIPVYMGDLNDDASIETFTLEVRAAADIAEGDPVRNAVRAAERLGCIVLPLQDELGRHLGLSQRLDGSPYIRVSRARENVPGDRQRFTVLHELGHLALHSQTAAPETAGDARLIEKQAHRFASAFVAPADPLLDHWQQLGGRVTLNTLVQLKAHWGLSVKALVVRFQQLSVIDADQAVALYKQISKRGWNTAEPVPVSNEESVWLRRALTKRFDVATFDAPTAALARAQHGLGRSHFDRWLEWSAAPEPDGDVAVVDFEARRGSRSASLARSRPATVTEMRRRR